MFQRQPWMQRAGEFPESDLQYHELLVRAVFSGGLGPRVVEARWEGISEAFCGFRPEVVAALGEADVSRLLGDPKVIRNRRKIEAVIHNAAEFGAVVTQSGSFHQYLADLEAGTDLVDAAAELAKRFKHLGPTSAALFLFSAGWRQQQTEVDDQVDAHRQADADQPADARKTADATKKAHAGRTKAQAAA